MEKPKQEEIPRSIIKGSGVVRTNLNTPKGKGSLMFLNPKCTVVGVHNLPYGLFATPEFNEDILPVNIRKGIYEVSVLVLQPSFSAEDHKIIKYCTIPKWLINFKKIESLRFDYVELDELNCLNGLPVQHLTFEHVKYDNSQKLIESIKQFRHLKEISYDKSLSADLIHSIEKVNLKLTPVSD